MGDSYIKILRKLLKWEWFNDSKMVHIFIYLLLSANHTSAKWRGISVERGQLITGLNSIKKSTGLSVRSIRTCIDRLKLTNEITIKSTNKFSIISIVKYDDYQNFDNNTTKKTTIKKTNERQSNDNQTTTDNNENNNNNEKEIKEDLFLPVINTWLEYKKERRESYAGEKSIEQFRKKLIQLSENNVEKADLIIKESMSNNWAGIFPLKNEQLGRKKITLNSIQGSHSFELTDQELKDKLKSGYWKKA